MGVVFGKFLLSCGFILRDLNNEQPSVWLTQSVKQITPRPSDGPQLSWGLWGQSLMSISLPKHLTLKNVKYLRTSKYSHHPFQSLRALFQTLTALYVLWLLEIPAFWRKTWTLSWFCFSPHYFFDWKGLIDSIFLWLRSSLFACLL